jgi:hypothetical protein
VATPAREADTKARLVAETAFFRCCLNVAADSTRADNALRAVLLAQPPASRQATITRPTICSLLKK